jgi:hypothetical protein
MNLQPQPVEQLIAEALATLDDLRHYSGYISDTEIVDTPSWNAALSAAQSLIANLSKPA